jgi:hypothetical protein
LKILNGKWLDFLPGRKVSIVNGAIQHDVSGMTRTVSFSDGSVSIATVEWRDVTTVVAFKRDLFTYDLLCVEIVTPTDRLELDEEMDGWANMLEELPVYLPGTLETSQWWNNVVHPAFVTNPTPLFVKSEHGELFLPPCDT